MAATEFAGFEPTGEFTQLNSYENRVFDIRLESSTNVGPVIAKFYRPGRWSQETILDEHRFLHDLHQEGIHVVAPMKLANDSTVIDFQGLLTSFFPKFRGRMPDEIMPQDLASIGRLLARVHNIGSQKIAEHRPWLDTSYYGGWETLDDLQDWIAPEMRQRYNLAAEKILLHFDNRIHTDNYIRIHGDCHRGNLLNNGQEFYLVDFDDCVMGPEIQDVWMLLSGDQDTQQQELAEITKGYEELREFPDHQIPWIPILRGYRIIGYAGWIARRWEDPSFRKIFPDFEEYRYWAEETEAIEKIAWTL